MLTQKQKELLVFIHERVKETGVPPSFDEMKEALDLRSKSGIHRLITALEERGFIRRLPHRARALEIVKLPEAMSQGLVAGRGRGFSPSVIEGSLGRVPDGPEGRERQIVAEERQIHVPPLVGHVGRAKDEGDAQHLVPRVKRMQVRLVLAKSLAMIGTDGEGGLV